MSRQKTMLEIVDVGGSFARLLREAPKIARNELKDAVTKTAFALEQRMKALAPVGPDAPHIRDALTNKVRGLYGQAGLIEATQPAAPGSDATLADVGVFNEYRPNKQPFMRPAADAEQKQFIRRATDALRQVERNLSSGGGLT